MRIPKRFKIFGTTIEVIFREDMVQLNDSLAHAKYRFNEIEIQADTNGVKRKKEQLERSFIHEVIHWMFYEIGDYIVEGQKLREDEVLVDLLAGALHQILTTAEYEEDS